MSSEVSPSPTQEQAQPRVTPAVRGLVIANVATLFLQLTLANFAGMAEAFGFSEEMFWELDLSPHPKRGPTKTATAKQPSRRSRVEHIAHR